MKVQGKLRGYARYLLQKELAENTRRVYLKQAELFLRSMLIMCWNIQGEEKRDCMGGD